MSRNNYIQNKSLRTFFIASVLTSVITQVDSLVDGIIVSHFVSPDVLSVINLSTPVMSILYLVAGMISLGASVLVTKEIGMQNHIKVARLFTASIIIAIIITGLAAAGLILCSDNVAILLTKEERLLPLLRSYLPVAFLGSVVAVIFTLAMVFVKMIGHPEKVTRAVVISAVANICLDILFVGVLSWGISGAAWATILSITSACIYLLPKLFDKDSIVKFVRPQNSWFFPCSNSLVVNGIPAAVGSVATAVLFALLNMLVLKAQGADGMFIMSICLQMMMISMLVLGGAAGAVTGIGGVMLGESDIDGYRSLVTGILKKSAIGLVLISVILLIYPDLLSRLFGASEDLTFTARGPLRIFCLSLLPLGLVTILDSSFLLQGHNVLSSVIQVLYLVCLIPLVWLASTFRPEYLWWAITASLWFRFLIVVCCSFVITRKRRDLHWFTLISKYPNDPGISLSVNYDRASVQEALNKIHSFLDICELDQSLSYKVDSCIDELTGNLISMTEQTGKSGSFDLRVVDTGKKIIITMKDDGKPYNPIIKYDATNGVNPEDANLALVILNAFCPDLNYKYMNGINCVYMNFPYGK